MIGDKLLASQTADVKPGVAQIKVPVGRDWGTGAYIVATLRRPLDAPAQRMPGRAIGIQWFSIDRAAKTLSVEVKPPSLLRPNTTLRMPVKIGGLAAGEDARIVVAAVDVGILNLTNYKPPSPDDYYLGQRALTAEIRDLYGQLIDGMQGARGQIRSGGDEGAQLQGSPPTGPPVALYSGIVSVGADGNAEVAFDIPEFAGTLRVMAVAWSKDKVGHGTADVVVRDPVVLTATLPRFLLPGDHRACSSTSTMSKARRATMRSRSPPLTRSPSGAGRAAEAHAARQGARRLGGPDHGDGRRHGRGARAGQRARGLCARAELHAGGANRRRRSWRGAR